ncbi:unnamed protein product [Rotaria sp. Silwood2]|nr:unnamed protein product [Rotaria sp. Silwood2]CAF2529351.1 unnamed protein product [Rotaria sp. Silwood2]CAF2763243.1 unnamed protein product [Rotaria sp. Silwood2]CAF2940437.1 unnamed protein product [Rotaria sp. Silwood2]CAF3976317.1 unnamed protein product [Rotaria sp. Silwood2]
MFRIRSKKLQNYYSVPRTIPQICYSYCDNKRHILLLILFLFTIPIIYSISYKSIESQIIDETDICSKLLDIIYNSNKTLCSEEANRRGNKQRIISLSVFGPKENSLFIDEKFSQFISPLIDEARLLFPTWTIRLYSDELTIDRLNLKNLSQLSMNIDICNVNQIPVVGNVGEYLSGKLWRFLPALDPMVDLLSSRDLDSPLTQREQVLIEQFINSSYLFLTIRDHPFHGIPILGGLWSSALYRNRLLFFRLFSILLDKIKVQQYSFANDQTLLTELIWPKIKHQALAFDSYTCQQFQEGNQYPFPTQRPSRDCHLGCVRPCCQNSSKIRLDKPCPAECRPKNHPDWIYC